MSRIDEPSILESMYTSTTSSTPSEMYWRISEPVIKIKAPKLRVEKREDIIINDEPVLFDPEELV